MELARQLVAEGPAKRKADAQPLKKPLAYIDIQSTNDYSTLSVALMDVVLEEVNVFNMRMNGVQLYPKVEVTVSADELEHMARARTLIRSIQVLRKEKGCTISESITVQLPEEYKSLPKGLLDNIATETVASAITWGNTLQISTG